VALVDALKWLQQQGHLKKLPVNDQVAAVAWDRQRDLLLDLNYLEDSKAEVDMNVIMTAGPIRRGPGHRGTPPFNAAN